MLLAVELQCRIVRGDSGRLEDYLERFADLGDDVRAAFNCAASAETVSSIKPKSVETHLSSQGGAGVGQAPGGTASSTTSDRWGFPRTPRFVNKGLLGEGGMGRVYRAFDTEQGEDVTFKVLLHAEDPGRLARFKDEFRVLSPTEISHPHFAPLYELLCVDGWWFLTMKLVDGVDFCTRCRPGGAVDLERLRPAFEQLTIGVAALHERGILHPDIKPSNVMVSERDGHVWILDFGLVAHLREDSLLGATAQSVAGTITYRRQSRPAARPTRPATCTAWACCCIGA